MPSPFGDCVAISGHFQKWREETENDLGLMELNPE